MTAFPTSPTDVTDSTDVTIASTAVRATTSSNASAGAVVNTDTNPGTLEKQFHTLCFIKKPFESIFVGENTPQLLYVGQTFPTANLHPRVMHAHPDLLEILLIDSGTSSFLIGGKKQPVQTGDLIIYNAGVVHDEIVNPDDPIGCYALGIGGLHMPSLRANALIPDDMGSIFPSGDSFSDLHALSELIFRQMSTGTPCREEICHHLLLAFLVKTLAVIEGRKIEKPQMEESHILGLRIQEYIDQHYSEPLTLQSIGEALHISPYYLCHVFKETIGYSPVQYLLRRRIGEAQTLLLQTDLSISQISEMVGYETQSYFNLQFTKHVGISPKKYRQNSLAVATPDGAETKKKKKSVEGKG